MLWQDLRRTYDKGYGTSRLRRLLYCLRAPGVHAVVVFRFGQWLQRQSMLVRLPLELPYFLLNALVQILWGIELSRLARIGPGLYIGHFGGITVHPSAVIGKNCALSQGVTIGMSGQGDEAGVPVIGDDVYIAPGARLFGKIRVGNNVKIGANAVIHRSLPDNAVAVLEPGFKVISLKGNRQPRDRGQAAV